MSALKDTFRIYYQNVRGLRTKTNIKSTISAAQFDIIAFTEHWLNENYENCEYFDNSYFVERDDRNRADKKWGGGALIAIKNHIAYKRCYDWERDISFENVWIELKNKSNTEKTFINVIYIPPKSNFNQYQKYLDSLTEIMCAREPNAKFLILGDFNLGASIEWFFYNNECLALSHEGDTATEIINTLVMNELMQINFLRNSNHRILDLALTNSLDFTLIPITEDSELSKIDIQHPPFEIQFLSKNLKFLKQNKTIKLNFFKANYELINYELNLIDWNSLLNVPDINVQVHKFYQVIENIIKRFTPTIIPKDDKYPKWFSKKLIELLKDKNYFYDRYKRTNNHCFHDIFKKKRREAKYELKACELNYTQSIENSIKSNTKAFFAYTKSLNKSNKLPNVMNFNNLTSNDPKIISNFFAKHFESVYEPDDPNLPEINYTCDCTEHIQITEDLIANVINSMNENKTNSPDGIPILFYKRTLRVITQPLNILFNSSLQQSLFPSEWKLSLVTPLYKNGDKSDVLNYRPISILSAISKIFEKIMYSHIQDRVKHLISPQQHGFAKNKSTISNLAEYVNFLSSNIANGGQIDTAYTDFAKAFDKVSHKILLKKIDEFPLNNCTKSWIYSFLTKRMQVVSVNGFKSNVILPTSSVPQGGILSPLLFSLFINDLPRRLKCISLLFADDCKIFNLINTIDDCRMLQDDLNTLSEWCIENKLQLNVKKCVIVSFTRRTDRTFNHYSYKINNTILNRSKQVKDLGILFDDKLSFKNHVQAIITRASKLLGFICRSLKPFVNINTHKLLYNTYVRNIIEYGSSIWNPYYHLYTNKLENIQRKFTRVLCYKFGIPRETYEQRLSNLNMLSLFTRRLYFDELLLYKIISNKLETNLIRAFNVYVPTRSTRFAPVFYLPSVASNIEYFSLTLRLKRHHNEYFTNIDLNDYSFSRTKKLILNSLPTELWPGFR